MGQFKSENRLEDFFTRNDAFWIEEQTSGGKVKPCIVSTQHRSGHTLVFAH